MVWWFGGLGWFGVSFGWPASSYKYTLGESIDLVLVCINGLGQGKDS